MRIAFRHILPLPIVALSAALVMQVDADADLVKARRQDAVARAAWEQVQQGRPAGEETVGWDPMSFHPRLDKRGQIALALNVPIAVPALLLMIPGVLTDGTRFEPLTLPWFYCVGLACSTLLWWTIGAAFDGLHTRPHTRFAQIAMRSFSCFAVLGVLLFAHAIVRGAGIPIVLASLPFWLAMAVFFWRRSGPQIIKVQRT